MGGKRAGARVWCVLRIARVERGREGSNCRLIVGRV